ncbi:hypothetical protein M9194_17685 [Vibrio sp. S4M6]|uniref:hypothetical protein n=1 Tax=Vibrio sinus TaxID=2946865 RepID=UPI002029C765|nr:hypothetical protein [Vibrio sinus]MCL9783264.1 hypothetical protein [Vibrio sinus]
MGKATEHNSSIGVYFWSLLFLLSIVVFIVYFRFYSIFNDHNERIKNLPYQPIETIGHSMNMELREPVVLTIPDSDISVHLNQVDFENSQLLGQYKNNSDGTGFLSLDSKHFIGSPINDCSYTTVLTHSPGDGVNYYYLSTFRYDAERQAITHVDSEYLGYNLKIHDLTLKGDLVKANVSSNHDGYQKLSVLATLKSNAELELLSLRQQY